MSPPTTTHPKHVEVSAAARRTESAAMTRVQNLVAAARWALVLPGAIAFFFSAQYCLAAVSDVIDTSGLAYMALWVAMNWMTGVLFIFAGVRIAPGIKVLVTVALTTAVMVWHCSIFNAVLSSTVASEAAVTGAAISAVGGMLVALVFAGYEIMKSWPRDDFSLATYDAIRRPKESASSR